MLSVTLGMGTAAADIHPVDAAELACMSADAGANHDAEFGGIEKDDSEKRPAHKHHTHSCGPCHLHMVGMNGLAFAHASPASLSLRPGADQNVPRGGPSGLYRPPRA